MIKIKTNKEALKINDNLLSGSFFLVLSLVFWYLIPTQIKVKDTSSINAQTFPKIIVGLIILASIGLIISSFIGKEKKYFHMSKKTLQEEKRPLIMALIILGYVILINIIGFIIASLILCIVTVAFYKIKKKSYYIITCVVSLAISYIFIKLLDILLP